MPTYPQNNGPRNAAHACLVATCLISVVPVVGFVVWIVALPLLLVSFILSIVMMSRGAKGGITTFIASVFVVPVLVLIGPIASTYVCGKFVKEFQDEKAEEKQAILDRKETANIPSVDEQPYQSEIEAQRDAVKMFPELGKSGSAFNKRFTFLARDYRAKQPSFFNDPGWPVTLAKIVGEEQHP